MTSQYVTKKVHSAGTYTPSGANTIAFAPGKSIRAKRVILVYTTAHTTPGSTLTVQRRPIAGTAANQVTLGTWLTPAAVAAGAVIYLDLEDVVDQPTEEDGLGGTTVSIYAGSDGAPAIAAGQDIAVVSDGGGDAGVANVYFEYFDDDTTVGTKVARVT
jgi:hypothetical protein